MKKIYIPTKKKTILIVDDDQVVIQMYQERFQSHAFKVEVAGTGHQAMQRLRKEPVDLVILDLCLPGMDGVEVVRNIRTELALQVLPVIAISNAYLGRLGQAALQAGATRCVTKAESTPDQMLKFACELLEGDHVSAGDTTSDGVEGDAGGTRVSQPGLEFRDKLIGTLLINAPEMLAKLRAGHQAFAKAKQEDLRGTELFEMHRLVRSLAGSAGFLGFEKLGRMANALEGLLIQLRVDPMKITPSVIRTVAQAIDALASLFGQVGHSQPEGLTPPRILVVDDEAISRETICSALGKAGLSAVSLDGSPAARRRLEQESFDLIFLDVEMPGESGPDLCVNIREMATNRVTPVVFVTSHSDFGSRARSTLSGGNDFIAKPFLLVELAVKALTWLFKEHPHTLSVTTAHDNTPAGADGDPAHATPGSVAPHDIVAENLGVRVSGAHLVGQSFAIARLPSV
jgi:CheY-like chemotaxis protein